MRFRSDADADDDDTTALLDEDDDDDDDTITSAKAIKALGADVVKRTETELLCRDAYKHYGNTLRHCYDDRACRVYGDCCRDSRTHYDGREQTAAAAGGARNDGYGCYRAAGMDWSALMIGRCPRTAANRTAADDMCETDDGDPRHGRPVTAAASGHVYRNAYCAWCNGERQRVLYWKPEFACHDGRSPAPLIARPEDAVARTLLYRDGRWYYANYDDLQLYPCYYRLRPADRGASGPRPCAYDGAGLVDGCPAGAPAPLARGCASHTYVLFEYGPPRRVFRNADCARCNGVATDRLTCLPTGEPALRAELNFEALFDVVDRRRAPCGPDELYDLPTDTCRDVIRDELSAAACRTYVTFGWGEYDGRSLRDDGGGGGGGTAYVYAYGRRVRYRARPSGDDGALHVCADDVRGPYPGPAYASWLAYAGVAGSCVSAAALVAHLALFGTSPEPKNLPDKNLASLAVSLLLGYACYAAVALGAVPAGDRTPCLAAALAMHYGFLAAFAWMSVMSADVWIVLYAATKKFRVARGKRHGRFAVYSAFAWLAPAAVTALAAALQLSALRPELRPDFQHACWFGNPRSLVALFVLPAGAAVAANYVSFVGAVRLIVASGDGLRSPGAVHSSRVNRSRNNLAVYMRLSLMMGLAWAFGLAGAVTDSDVVWTLYTVLNSLHGAFIFLAFDCNWNAVRALALFRRQPSGSESQTATATATATTTTSTTAGTGSQNKNPIR